MIPTDKAIQIGLLACEHFDLKPKKQPIKVIFISWNQAYYVLRGTNPPDVTPDQTMKLIEDTVMLLPWVLDDGFRVNFGYSTRLNTLVISEVV